MSDANHATHPFKLNRDGLSRYEEALLFTARLHAAQRRKGTDIPYISHLIAVSALVLEHGGTEDDAIGALLHDSIEDQAKHWGGAEALRKEIQRRFGKDVMAIIDGCTDADSHPKPPWRERKEAYITHLAEAPASVLLVSCADKLHNARAILGDYRTIGDELWSRFSAGRDAILWYYRSLADAFLAQGVGRIAEELNRTVSELEHVAFKQAS